jgi:hypothetical protein
MNSVIQSLLASSTREYTTKHVRGPDGEPVKIRLQRIGLFDLVISGKVPFSLVESGGNRQQTRAELARAKALANHQQTKGTPEDVALAALPPEVQKALKLIEGAIEVIVQGSPDLRDPETGKPLLFLYEKDCPRLPDGTRAALLYCDLGDDFYDIMFEVIELSMPNMKEAADKAGTFPVVGGRDAGRTSGRGGKKIRRPA